AERQHADDRPEDLVAGDRHLIADVVEDGRLDEEAVAADPLAAGDQPRALLLAEVDVMQDLVELLLRDLGALLGLRILRVADDAPLGLLGEPLDELVLDLRLDEQPAAGRAALA